MRTSGAGIGVLVGMTVFTSTFGGKEAAVILEVDLVD